MTEVLKQNAKGNAPVLCRLGKVVVTGNDTVAAQRRIAAVKILLLHKLVRLRSKMSCSIRFRIRIDDSHLGRQRVQQVDTRQYVLLSARMFLQQKLDSDQVLRTERENKAKGK